MDIKEIIKKPEFREILKKAVEYEQDRKFERDTDGWSYSDLPAEPLKINKLVQKGIIKITLKTNSGTWMRLADFDETKKILDEYVEEDNMFIEKELIIKETVLTEEDEQRFTEILKEHDGLEYWKDYIAPVVMGRENMKKAVLLMLASMWDKPEYDEKNRINIIFHGRPGTGKSAFKNFLVREFGAIDINGDRVSQADLTYNKMTEELGCLARADKSIIAIEESDKMEKKAFGSILTSLGETGYIAIRDKKIKAETKGLLLANDISKWAPEVLNRFTFRIETKKLDDIILSKALDYRYKYWNKEKPSGTINDLRKFLKWIHDYEPEIQDLDKIQKFKEDNIKWFDDIRMGLEVMRISLTISRLNMKPVTVDTYIRACKLYHEMNNGHFNE